MKNVDETVRNKHNQPNHKSYDSGASSLAGKGIKERRGYTCSAKQEETRTNLWV